MKARPLFILIAAAAAVAPAAAEKRIATASGHPEILLLGRDLVDARGQIAYVCEKIGWKVVSGIGRKTLRCDVPTRELVSVLMQQPGVMGSGRTVAADGMMNLNNWTKLPVVRQVHFEFEPIARGVVVQARAERRIPAAGNPSRYERQPIDDADTFNGLLNVIALAGDSTFAPGTTFADVGYLGFRSDRFADVDIAGRTRTAIQIGVVEPGSPAEGAGLKTGDFILSMNGRDFGSYREVSKYLSELDPGTQVAMLVERGGQRMAMSATATTPPPLAP